MKIIALIIILFILFIYLYKFLVNRSKRASYFKAGKKWEGIVEELRRRK